VVADLSDHPQAPATAQGDDPNVDHSSLAYLVDAAGKYVGYFPPGTAADRMAEVIRASRRLPKRSGSDS
jgi:protein SCO1